MRLHVIDGTYELFRAYFSKRPSHVTPQGWDAKATVGVAASLLSLLRDPAEAVTHIAVAFDNPVRSFRNDLYDGYKTEAGVPQDLLDQFDRVEEAVSALGIVVWSMKEYEADDALATAAARFRDQVDQVRIMTPDKDLGQCIRGKRVVQVDRRQQKEIDEDELRKLRGIAPESIPDFLALTGDTADGIPGIPGFGVKTAATLLAEYRHLEAIPDYAHEWSVKPRGALQLATTLAERRDDAHLYRKLATLVEDAPINRNLEELEFRGTPRVAFEAWCDRLGLTTMRASPATWRD